MSTTALKIPRAYRDAVDRVPHGVLPGHHVADLSGVDDELVVFLIGMRIHRLRKVRTWLPVASAMPRMLIDLVEDPELGLLHYEMYLGRRTLYAVQYWRSAEHLGRFARDPGQKHAPAWSRFNRLAARTGDVGIFHETYRVPAENAESLYGNMPPHGLGKALGAAQRAGSRRTATHERMGSTTPEYVDAG
jgi:hypothetical protein